MKWGAQPDETDKWQHTFIYDPTQKSASNSEVGDNHEIA